MGVMVTWHYVHGDKDGEDKILFSSYSREECKYAIEQNATGWRQLGCTNIRIESTTEIEQ